MRARYISLTLVRRRFVLAAWHVRQDRKLFGCSDRLWTEFVFYNNLFLKNIVNRIDRQFEMGLVKLSLFFALIAIAVVYYKPGLVLQKDQTFTAFVDNSLTEVKTFFQKVAHQSSAQSSAQTQPPGKHNVLVYFGFRSRIELLIRFQFKFGNEIRFSTGGLKCNFFTLFLFVVINRISVHSAEQTKIVTNSPRN